MWNYSKERKEELDVRHKFDTDQNLSLNSDKQ